MLRYVARAAYRGVVGAWYAIARFRHARFEPSVVWKGGGKLDIGRRVYVGQRTVISAPVGCELQIGAGAWIGPDCELAAGERMEIGARTSLRARTELHGDVRIGSGCVAAPNLYISSGWHEFAQKPFLPIRVQDYHQAHQPRSGRSRPVTVGDDCWFGINVVVTPGVTVGRGCVIGANSVVTRDLSPYTIAAGTPARTIGTRLAFSPPSTLSAASDTDLPYFYAGFAQLGQGEPDDAAPARSRGGLAAAHRSFTLALLARAGDAIAVTVDATVSGRLTHGDQVREIGSGRELATFAARPGLDGFLTFAWDPDVAGVWDGLVVLEARCDDPPPAELIRHD